ncbi:MAG: YbhB/YbcL family Raf kinase inhibitor-like protein [candidate division WOR-3 bacterium]|jgi:Raf kinase inhibitor-like YbhB/YbcL family protein
MKRLLVVFLSVIILTGCGGPKSAPTVQSGRSAAGAEGKQFSLSSPAFAAGQKIPPKYTGDGEDVSPALNWDNVPEKTRSFALICSDPDAPVGTFIHWVIYDIPAEVRGLAEGLPRDGVLDNGARQGINGFRNIGYNGPKPPPGKPHRYFFRLYALDTVLEVEPGISAGRLQGLIAGHILSEAELMGVYGR